MQKTQRERTFSSLEGKRPTGTGHSAGWNERDPQEQDIQLAGIQRTHMYRTFSWLDCRRHTGTEHSAGWTAGDPLQ